MLGRIPQLERWYTYRAGGLLKEHMKTKRVGRRNIYPHRQKGELIGYIVRFRVQKESRYVGFYRSMKAAKEAAVQAAKKYGIKYESHA